MVKSGKTFVQIAQQKNVVGPISTGLKKKKRGPLLRDPNSKKNQSKARDYSDSKCPNSENMGGRRKVSNLATSGKKGASGKRSLSKKRELSTLGKKSGPTAKIDH